MTTGHTCSSEGHVNNKPIVFIGPSMPLAEAAGIIDADFRPPCKRGDIAQLPPTSIVALIDGVFDQSLSVSPREILRSIHCGMVVYGASSMGALRAAEVPEMRGLGRVYELYAAELIDNDDEVALLFDPDRLTALTIPLVNVRFAVERLVQSETISEGEGKDILKAAMSLHYSQRNYVAILRAAGYDAAQTATLIPFLSQWDLKRDDARLLLEHLARGSSQDEPLTAAVARPPNEERDSLPLRKLAVRTDASSFVSIWETGDSLSFDELVEFLVVTNRIGSHADRALSRLLVSGALSDIEAEVEPMAGLRPRLARHFRSWGWRTEEEIKVTLADLGLGLRDLAQAVRADAVRQGMVATLLRNRHPLFLNALRAELFLSDIALKREATILGSIKHLARRSSPKEGSLSGIEIVCALHGTRDPESLIEWFDSVGLQADKARHWCDLLEAAFVHHDLSAGPIRPKTAASDAAFGLSGRSRRPANEDRFSLPISEAFAHAQIIKRAIGVTRIGLVQGLTDLNGIFVAQAARPAGAWSSTYGSGKSETKEGAVVGAVMEEVEKWSNERFVGTPEWLSYQSLLDHDRLAIDPQTLDLPFDTPYSRDLVIPWLAVADLLQGATVMAPAAAWVCYFNAGSNNIFLSKRGSRAVFSTNGLASGFDLAEALIHATCEVIERHNAKLAELLMENPGLSNSAESPTALALDVDDPMAPIEARIKQAGFTIQAYDIAIDIPVPTVLVRLSKEGRVSPGWGCHPNPRVAYKRALLEACQTLANVVAGGREDLALQARSLGRHERPRPARPDAEAHWKRIASRPRPLGEYHGYVGLTMEQDLDWIRDRLWSRSIHHLLAIDLTSPEIAPARVVRVVVPGLETCSPYHCGPRARRILAADLLNSSGLSVPRGAYGAAH